MPQRERLITENFILSKTVSQDLTEIFEQTFELHKKTLAFLDVSNPKLLVLFSGTPGMGKTTVAKVLENTFQANRLSTDEARKFLSCLGFSISLADQYIAWCLEKINSFSPNKMFILDRSVDRTYVTYQKFAQHNNYEIILVKMFVPRSLVEERIRLRQREDTEIILQNQDRFWRDYELFNVTNRADILFENINEIELYLESLITKISEKRKEKMPLKRLANGSVEYQNIRETILAAKVLPFYPDSFPHFDEIIPGLFLGNQIAASDELLQHNFSHMLTLRSNPGRPLVPSIVWKGIEVADSEESSIAQFFNETFDFIEQTTESILVHCREGISRSPSVVIAYLMKKFDLSFETAFHYVKTRRRAILPNSGFIEELKTYEKSLRVTL